jgi:repressor LexA
MTGPTEKQAQVLEFIKSQTIATQLPPSIRELATHLQISPTAVLCHLEALERKKLIVRRKGVARGLFPVSVEVQSDSEH